MAIVDDDERARLALAAELRAHLKHKVEVRAEGGGVAAFVEAVQQKPRVLVLEATLHGMNGVVVCKVLKGLRSMRGVRIIGVSPLQAVADEFARAGADAFLLKPVDARLAAELVKALCEEGQEAPDRSANG